MDTFRGARHLTGALSGATTIIAGSGADTITGGTGADRLEGGGGNDILTAGHDADTVIGGDGADTVMGAAGDVLDGGNDNDMLLVTTSYGDTADTDVVGFENIGLSDPGLAISLTNQTAALLIAGHGRVPTASPERLRRMTCARCWFGPGAMGCEARGVSNRVYANRTPGWG